jgi:PAS domain S-box-containing protein
MDRLRSYLTEELRKLSIADKIHGIVAVLVILTTLLLAMAVQSVRLQGAFRRDLATSATAALNIERVNALVYAIVMESRGVYMSTDRDKVKLFSDAILARSRDLSRVVTEWRQVVRDDDAEQFAVFKKRIDQFIDFRGELVRRAIEIGPAAGRLWGDNDANRSTRKALNDDLAALEKIYAGRARDAVELGEQGRYASWYLVALGFGALLLAALNVFVMKRFVIQPLSEIAEATDEIAAGNVKLSVPFITRKDEIGRLAHAVQNFRETTIRNMELQERELATAKARDAAIGQRDSLDDRYHAAKWQLSAAINNISQGLVMLDSSAQIVVINEQFRRIYGLPAETKAGCSLSEVLRCQAGNGLLVGSVAENLAAMTARIAQRKPSSREIELADGRVVRVSEQPMDGGGWVATHEDFTEERRMQRVLERTERFLVTVIENVPEAIAAKDSRSLRYVFVNRAAEKLFGLPRSAIIGKTARELFPREIADMIEQGDRRLLDGHEQLEAEVHNIETPEGRHVRAVRRVPVRGPDGESRVFLSMIEDRTDWVRQGNGAAIAA